MKMALVDRGMIAKPRTRGRGRRARRSRFRSRPVLLCPPGRRGKLKCNELNVRALVRCSGRQLPQGTAWRSRRSRSVRRTTVEKDVSATISGRRAPVVQNDCAYLGEVIETHVESLVRFRFLDDTQLSVGRLPRSGSTASSTIPITRPPSSSSRPRRGRSASSAAKRPTRPMRSVRRTGRSASPAPRSAS